MAKQIDSERVDKYPCEVCSEHFEYNEGKLYDCGTFVCYECYEEINT